jgi:curved DNA-binding protein CbpA
MSKDYYKILDLTQNTSAKQIKSAYRSLAKQWHPDRNNNSKASEERFKLISEAYHVLSNPESRRQYDRSTRREYGQYSHPSESGFNKSADNGNDEEHAETCSMDDMHNAAWEMAEQNMQWIKIAIELSKMGCPRSTAYKMARNVARDVAAQRRDRTVAAFAKVFFRSGVYAVILIAIILSVNDIKNEYDSSGKNAQEINETHDINPIEKNAVEAMKEGKSSYNYMSGVLNPQLYINKKIPEPETLPQPELNITQPAYNPGQDAYIKHRMMEDSHNTAIMNEYRNQLDTHQRAIQANQHFNAIEHKMRERNLKGLQGRH